MFRCAFYLWKGWLTYIYRNSTCYENPNNPSCIDHILTKWSKEFFKNRTVFTGLSDFDKLILSVFKLNFSKAKTKEISYKDFKRFREITWIGIFRIDSQYNLKKNPPILKKFSCTLKEKRVVRANHAPYITKTLRKAIMKLSYLEKIYFINKMIS